MNIPRSREGGSMNCKEAIALIAEFLEQTLTAETLAKSERMKTRLRSLLLTELRRGGELA